MGERLAPGPGAPADERLDVLVEAMSDLRDRVAELEERQDFAERMMARQEERKVLPREVSDG
jgi:hypothetical protein